MAPERGSNEAALALRLPLWWRGKAGGCGRLARGGMPSEGGDEGGDAVSARRLRVGSVKRRKKVRRAGAVRGRARADGGCGAKPDDDDGCVLALALALALTLTLMLMRVDEEEEEDEENDDDEGSVSGGASAMMQRWWRLRFA